MNEWDRSCTRVPVPGTLLVEHYKAEYPSGTRIMLLSMGEDIHRIGDDAFGGTWLSDYVPNCLGGFDSSQPEEPVEIEEDENLDSGMSMK